MMKMLKYFFLTMMLSSVIGAEGVSVEEDVNVFEISQHQKAPIITAGDSKGSGGGGEYMDQIALQEEYESLLPFLEPMMDDRIFMTNNCYELKQKPVVNWDYSNPANGDWIGMYPATETSPLGDNYCENWVWVKSKTQEYQDGVRPSGRKFLPNTCPVGEYKTWIARRFGYDGVISTNDFRVSAKCCQDDPTWSFFRASDSSFQTCDFVAQRPVQRCKREGVDGRVASKACLVACQSCVCRNKANWRYTPDVGSRKTCDWVAVNPTGRCHLIGDNGNPATKDCKDACGQCTCRDSQFWRFLQNNGNRQNCNWVGQNPGNRCSLVGEDGTRARQSCLAACNRCNPIPLECPTGAKKPIDLVANPVGSLGECEGDCDSDADCEGSLECFHRDQGDFSAVPGCQGGTMDGSRTDYCTDPDLPLIDVIANPNPDGGECEGDCDTDDDCDGDLVCFQRNENAFTAVPGCQGGEDDGSRTDYCVDPNLPVIDLVSNPVVQQLEECQGDCDNDSDCAGNLVCFFRDQGECSDVPGCTGGSSDCSRTDYCVHPDWLDCEG